MKMIHLTDTHLVPRGQKLYGLDPCDRLQKAVADINAQHSDAELCIITGDLTHRAEPEAYQALRQCLSKLTMPCQLVIGNHDSRQQMQQCFPDLKTDSHGFVQSSRATSVGQFIFLDTVQSGTHAGAYCAHRLEWLHSQLEAYKNNDVFLFMHHPPFSVGIPSLDAIGLLREDARAIKSVLRGFGNIRHLFFGHLHRPLNGSWQRIGFSTIRGTNHQVWLDFSTKAEIPGSHEQPAYAIAFVDEEQVLIHTHDYLDNSLKFSLGSWDWDAWQKQAESSTTA